jgi:hypothetical protein
LQQQPTSQNKTKVPPFTTQEPTKKQGKINRCNIVNKTRSKWISKTLEEAMDAIEGGITSLWKANRH